MPIYDPLSEVLGIESDPKLFENIFLNDEFEILNEYNPKICREEAIKRNLEIVICDKCGISGNRPNMMRWHFENCKTILKKCKGCQKIIPRQNIKDFLYNKKTYCNRKCYMKTKKGITPIIMTSEVKGKISKKAKLQSEEQRRRSS